VSVNVPETIPQQVAPAPVACPLYVPARPPDGQGYAQIDEETELAIETIATCKHEILRPRRRNGFGF
jgi:hypothetical protein